MNFFNAVPENVAIFPEFIHFTDPVISKEINLALSHDFLQRKYLVSDLAGLINALAKDWLLKIRPDLSLHGLDYRNSLPADEKRVAMIFAEHQLKHPNGLTVNDLKSYLPDMEELKIKAALNRFREKRLVKTIEAGSDIFYYAPLS